MKSGTVPLVLRKNIILACTFVNYQSLTASGVSHFPTTIPFLKQPPLLVRLWNRPAMTQKPFLSLLHLLSTAVGCAAQKPHRDHDFETAAKKPNP